MAAVHSLLQRLDELVRDRVGVLRLEPLALEEVQRHRAQRALHATERRRVDVDRGRRAQVVVLVKGEAAVVALGKCG